MSKSFKEQEHSSAWVFQTWVSFILSVSATTIGILYFHNYCYIHVAMFIGTITYINVYAKQSI